MLICQWFFNGSENICVFDEDECPRAIWEQIRSKKEIQIEPKWSPKSIKKMYQNRDRFLIDFWRPEEALGVIDWAAGELVPGGPPPKKAIS